MIQCPKCGRYLSNQYKYGYVAGDQIVWKCPCGYSSERDRSGLNYMDIIGRYHFSTTNKLNIRYYN